MLFGLMEFIRIKRMPAHKSMLDVSALIYETCKTYLFQQGKLLILLEAFIGACIFYYFFGLQHMELPKVLLILLWSVLGILGILRRGLVRYPHQHLRQLAARLSLRSKASLTR